MLAGIETDVMMSMLLLYFFVTEITLMALAVCSRRAQREFTCLYLWTSIPAAAPLLLRLKVSLMSRRFSTLCPDLARDSCLCHKCGPKLLKHLYRLLRCARLHQSYSLCSTTVVQVAAWRGHGTTARMHCLEWLGMTAAAAAALKTQTKA
jgi:hypothetical protein